MYTGTFLRRITAADLKVFDISRDGAERAAVDIAIAYYEDIPYILRGEREDAPLNAMRAPWHVDDHEVEAWLAATACYRTQLTIMFGEADWRTQFASHARSGRAAYWAVGDADPRNGEQQSP